MSQEKPVTQQSKLVRLPEVIRLSGRKRSSIYEDMKRGDFPLAVKIGPRAVAWHRSEVEHWRASRKPYNVGGA